MRFRMIGIGSMAVVLALMMGGPASAGGNLVTNPGFETGDFTGWTEGGNFEATFVTTAGFASYNPNSGTYFAALGPVGSDGTLGQTLATTAGQAYTFSWYLASNGTFINDFSAYWNGTQLFSQTNIPSTGSPVPAYVLYSYTEVATGPTSTIQFDFRNDPSYLALDDVSVVASAVPEPSSMVLACMGGLSLAVVASLRRRRGARRAA